MNHHAKRGTSLLAILLISILLISSLVSFSLAQTNQTPNITTPDRDDSGKETSESLGDATTEGILKIAEKTNPIAEYQVKVPEILQKYMDWGLGLGRKGETLTSAKLLISIMIWILLFLAFHNAISLFSALSNRTNMAIAAVFTLILSSLGVVNFISEQMIKIGQGISVIKDWSAGQLLIWILILVLVIYILNQVSKWRKRHDKIIHAKLRGLFVGADIAAAGEIVKSHARIAKKIAKESGAPPEKLEGGFWRFRGED